MKFERKEYLILIVIFLFLVTLLPISFFTNEFKKYANFLNIWSGKSQLNIIHTTGIIPITKKNNKIKFDVKQPELKVVKFSLKNQKAEKVNIAGDFNKWDKKSIELINKGKDSWETLIPLLPGKYKYVYYVDNNKILDPLNPATEMFLNERVSVIKVK